MDRIDQLIAAVEDFIRETPGIVCMNEEHDHRLRDARDKLHLAMLDAKHPKPGPMMERMLADLNQSRQTAKRIIREERKNERTIGDIDCVRLD